MVATARRLTVSATTDTQDVSSRIQQCDEANVTLNTGDQLEISFQDMKAGESVLLRIAGYYDLVAESSDKH